jgi:putative tricarboxylic transport membrane protein
MPTNRGSGLMVALAGLVLWLFIIPAHTETVDYGWMRPQTLPAACAIALMLLGTAEVVKPGAPVRLDLHEALRVGLFAALALLAVWAMTRFGFLVTAPVFALTTMFLVGERRPGWLAAGAIAMPGAIWLVAVPLLDRTLP